MSHGFYQRLIAIMAINVVAILLLTKLMGQAIIASMIISVISTLFVYWLWDKIYKR